MQKPGMRGAVFLVILRPKSSYFVRPSWQDWFKIGPLPRGLDLFGARQSAWDADNGGI